ncbi:MAG: hypothetical protein DRJ52_05370 [Thermoprotei archaeon]|nr:MAG: hypothetical protein DRJ52_05370 [Thermoprotei archaeon]
MEMNGVIFFSKEKLIEVISNFLKNKRGWLILSKSDVERAYGKNIAEEIDLVCKDGQNTIFIIIPRWTRKNYSKSYFLTYLAKAATYTGIADKVYIVLPKSLFTPRYVDGNLLKECGVGVITYFSGRVEEAFPSFSLTYKSRFSDFSSIRNKIKELENKVAIITDEVSLMKSHLEKLDNIIQELEAKISKISESAVNSRKYSEIIEKLEFLERNVAYLKQKAIEKSIDLSDIREDIKLKETTETELPDYLVDNPWLKVLRKRR